MYSFLLLGRGDSSISVGAKSINLIFSYCRLPQSYPYVWLLWLGSWVSMLKETEHVINVIRMIPIQTLLDTVWVKLSYFILQLSHTFLKAGRLEFTSSFVFVYIECTLRGFETYIVVLSRNFFVILVPSLLQICFFLDLQ